MAAAAGKKSATYLSLFMEACGLEVEKELPTFGLSVLGRRGLEGKMASRTKRSLDEAGSRSSDVETSKRTCRSSDVRDPSSGCQVGRMGTP